MTRPQPRRADRRWRPRPALAFAPGSRPCSSRPRPGSPAPWGRARLAPARRPRTHPVARRPPRLLDDRHRDRRAARDAVPPTRDALPPVPRLPGPRAVPVRALRGAGNVRVLERRIRDAREEGAHPASPARPSVILGLVAALSAHDRKTRGHSERVRAFTDLVATGSPPAGGRTASVAVGGAPARHRQAPSHRAS